MTEGFPSGYIAQCLRAYSNLWRTNWILQGLRGEVHEVLDSISTGIFDQVTDVMSLLL